ncbi:type II toxin-antitoxin system ParD family antitoxin [Paraburkholderia edwinii]|jgi:putative addiction module CopG family antidote|uniref:Type II toxin-antitoxin system ParD family antitoxin n=1 Tax=Paraburkholderia edwinii TaxID=2861782 RepID=A0ABX8UEA7_9BURK|nr:type II toxin-antitoxin system ParD family antitoxin [Paraburkholderia edwinii]
MPSKHALSVSLTERLASFVRTEIAEGRYSTASEVVRAGLRLLEQQTTHPRQDSSSDGKRGARSTRRSAITREKA